MQCPSHTQRRDILTGSHEPTDEESHWPADEDDEEEGKPGGCGYFDVGMVQGRTAGGYDSGIVIEAAEVAAVTVCVAPSLPCR